MVPTNVLNARVPTLLATDTVTLDQAADALMVHLAKAPFTPGPLLALGDLTECDFDGYAPLAVPLNAQLAFLDPLTGNWVVQLKDPLGGWHWQTTGLTNLPQLVYGYYLTDNAGAVVYGAELFPQIPNLVGVGQGVDVGLIKMQLLPGYLG